MKLRVSKTNKEDIIKLKEMMDLLHTLTSERDLSEKEKADFGVVERFVEAEVGHLVLGSIEPD